MTSSRIATQDDLAHSLFDQVKRHCCPVPEELLSLCSLVVLFLRRIMADSCLILFPATHELQQETNAAGVSVTGCRTAILGENRLDWLHSRGVKEMRLIITNTLRGRIEEAPADDLNAEGLLAFERR